MIKNKMFISQRECGPPASIPGLPRCSISIHAGTQPETRAPSGSSCSPWDTSLRCIPPPHPAAGTWSPPIVTSCLSPLRLPYQSPIHSPQSSRRPSGGTVGRKKPVSSRVQTSGGSPMSRGTFQPPRIHFAAAVVNLQCSLLWLCALNPLSQVTPRPAALHATRHTFLTNSPSARVVPLLSRKVSLVRKARQVPCCEHPQHPWPPHSSHIALWDRLRITWLPLGSLTAGGSVCWSQCVPTRSRGREEYVCSFLVSSASCGFSIVHCLLESTFLLIP